MTRTRDVATKAPWAGFGEGGDQHGAPRRPGQVARSLKDAADTLRRWLEARVPGCAPTIRHIARPVGAGGSNETVLCWIEADLGGGRAAHQWVLRIEPGDYRLFRSVDLALQFELLRRLHGHGLKVPKPLWFEGDSDWFGRPFFVMAKADGRVPVSTPPYNQAGFLAEASPAQRHRAWRSAIEELAAIHRLDAREFHDLWNVAPEDAPSADYDEQIRSFDWARGDREAPFLQEVKRWLDTHRPRGEAPGLSWGDARIGNMVFGRDFALTAVLDWEQASLGGPLRDLGWWLFFDELYSDEIGLARLDGMGNRQDTIDLWTDLTGHSVNALQWFEVFAGFQLGVLMMRRCFLQGRSSPGQNRNNNLFHRKLAKMLGLNAPEDMMD